MDLTINNEISKNNIVGNEVKNFMKELENSLTKDTTRINDLYNEILQENPLASKYESQLSDIIKDCMDTLSYEYDFLYFDYDKNKKSYFLDYYSEGDIIKDELSKEDLEGTNFKNGTFWKIYDKENVIEADYLKDNIKINVESELKMLDSKNKKKVGEP